MAFILGLTGGIGSGKSVASNHFETLGVTVVDSDIIAREVVALNSPALQHISEYFGKDILLATGELDRDQLRQRIFSNQKEKHWLEQLLHPLIRESTKQQLSIAPPPYSILSSPLLFESEQYRLTNRTLLIDCEEELQVSRAKHRDNTSSEDIKRIMSTQLSCKDRRQRADDIINNNGSISDLQNKIDNYHHSILISLQ